MEDLKNDKRLFIFRRLSIIAQKLYELSKYNEKFSNYNIQGNCGRFSDMSVDIQSSFIFPNEKLQVYISCYNNSYINLKILPNNLTNNVLKISIEKHDYVPHIINKFEVTTTYKTAKSAYKIFKKFENALDNELKRYYNLCKQNESLYEDFENLIGA